MLFLRNKKESSRYGVIIDIASGTVGVALVKSNLSQENPEILYSYRTSPRSTSDPEKMLTNTRNIRETLFSACLEVANEGLSVLQSQDSDAQISHVFLTCSSPWAHTVARNTRYESDKPFKVTRSIISDLIKNAEDEIISYTREHSQIVEKDFEVIERATVDIAVNDYLVDNPYQNKVNTVSLTHISGLAPKELIVAIEDMQDKLFPHTKLRMHTFMLVIYCVLRDMYPQLHSLCIVDVTGETTEFGIVENNLLVENSYMKGGAHTFLRDIAEQRNAPLVDVYTQLSMLESSECVEAEISKKASETYISNVQAHIQSVLKTRILPKHIVVNSQHPLASQFVEMLKKAFEKSGHTDYEIIDFSVELFKNSKNARTLKDSDVYLSTASRFFHKLHGCAEPEVNE